MGFLFKKKSKYKELDYQSLAEAIAYNSGIYSWFNLFSCDRKDKEKYSNYCFHIDEHISIKFKCAYISQGVWSTYEYCHMKVETYIDGILVNMYDFKINLNYQNHIEDIGKWYLEEKTIIHKISNEMIDVINNWAKINSQPYKNLIEDKLNTKKQKKEYKRKQFEDEENRISQLIDSYKNK